MELSIIAVLVALVVLPVLGWGKDMQWARVMTFILAAIIVGALLLFVYIVWALGQANWSY